MTSPCNLLFVYGSLTRQSQHPMHKMLNQQSRYLCPGYFHGKLYLIADYPGAIVDSTCHHHVYGELYEVTNPLLFERLDHYEECTPNFPTPHEYHRQVINVHHLHSNKTESAWSYLYNHSVIGKKWIESGRYIDN